MTNSIFLVLSEKVLENKFEIVDKFETGSLFKAQKLFKKKFGIDDDKQACFNKDGYFVYLERKNLSENEKNTPTSKRNNKIKYFIIE